MFGLVDCNNFYASCERVFNPSLIGRPVVILSNNDGCVIARSNEVKALGIKMGVPFYQLKQEVKDHNIAVYSSNYTLYGDMSKRVMSILAGFTPNMEVYSIDEAFLDLKGFDQLAEYGKHIVDTTTRWTGIPVSMGVAPTKTLAKLANRFAKRYKGYDGVCCIDTEDKRIKALQKTGIGDIWGIGRRNEKKLQAKGVKTAFDFAQLDRSWIRKYMTVVGERTWLELNGSPCIEIDQVAPDKKQICTSRSFGKPTSDIVLLKEAVAYYAAVCAEKLRGQQACACSILVFIHTNNFREDLPQYYNSKSIELPVPSSSTIEITNYVHQALESIYREGYVYKKAGVIITEIVADGAIQTNLFDTVDRAKHKRIMQVMDSMNKGFTRNVLNLASQGQKQSWGLKREFLSPCYSTNMSESIELK